VVERTCVGCRSVAPPAELLRLVVAPEGEVVPDLAGGAFGRGAWVHARAECIQQAAMHGLSRTLRVNVRTSPAELVERIRDAAARRLRGLLASAFRTKNAEAGATAVKDAVARRRAELILVATDARAAADLAWLAPLVASGTALAFGTKAEFGEWLGRPDTALVSVNEPRLADAAKKAIFLTMLRPLAPSTRTRRGIVTEVG
jgi:predicted RNA-binding protein YlxR (DUF448 family)